MSPAEHRLRELWTRVPRRRRRPRAAGGRATTRPAAGAAAARRPGRRRLHRVRRRPDRPADPRRCRRRSRRPHRGLGAAARTPTSSSTSSASARSTSPTTSRRSTPLDRGSAIHAAIDRLPARRARRRRSSRRDPTAGPTSTPPPCARPASEVADELHAAGRTGRTAFWVNERARAARRARRVAGVRPSAAGPGGPCAVVRADVRRATARRRSHLPDGGAIALPRQIDRVDELPDGTIVVTDHKTGSARELDNDLRRRPDARRPPGSSSRSYAAAARAAARHDRTPRCAPSTPSSSRTSSASADVRRRRRGGGSAPTWPLVVDGIEAGVYPAGARAARPTGTTSSCWFCEPDGLGTAEPWADWERKRHDPRAGPMVRRRRRRGRRRWLSSSPPARRRAASIRRPAPPDQAARERIRTDTATDAVRRGGRRRRQDDRARRAILTLVDEGVPIDAIAAITFTEKAAAELRHRLRAAARRAAGRAPLAPSRARRPRPRPDRHAARLRPADPASSSRSRPACRPGFGVLDELESQLALDERWEDLLDELLDDADREVAPGLPAAELVQLCEWPKFGGTQGSAPGGRGLPGQLGPRRRACRRSTRRRVRPSGCAPVLARVDRRWSARRSQPTTRQAELLAELAERAARIVRDGDLGTMLGGLEAIKQRTRQGRPPRQQGRTGATTAARDALDALRGARAAVAERRRRLPRVWRTLPPGRRRRDRRALRARRRPRAGGRRHARVPRPARARPPAAGAASPASAPRLHERYQRVLLDEFQDTDPIQLEIAVRLTAAPARPARRPTVTLRPLPGRLFVVGDPKQSIYRFRRADIAVYLARRRPGRRRARGAVGELPLDRAPSSTGSTACSPTSIQPEPGVQPAYRPARRLPAATPRPRHGARARRRRSTTATTSTPRCCASARRRRWPPPWPPRSARAGRSATATAALRPCRPGDIAVLLPARTSLPMLEAALARSRVPYRAENASVVYVAPEIRSLHAGAARRRRPDRRAGARRRPAHPAVRLQRRRAVRLEQAGGRWSLFADPPGGAGRPPGRRRPSPTSARSPTTSAGRRRPTCSTASSTNAASSRRRSPGPTPATCGGACATSSTRPGRGPTPAAGACAATCAGPPTRPPRAGRATRSCPSTTTTRCGS